jgi:hypothetical protein
MTSRLFCILVMMYAASVQAGAWLQPHGSGLFITQQTFFSSSNYLDADGKRVKQPRFTKLESQPYIEYGLLPNMTIGGTAFPQINTQGEAQKTGIADPQLFVRSTVWHDTKQLISLQPLIKLPSQFRNQTTPRGGSSSTDYELSLLYGRNLHWLSARDYFDARLGYRVREKTLHDQLHADFVFGLGLFTNWQIIPAIRSTFATNRSAQAFSESGDLDYDLVKIEMAVNYRLSNTRTLQMSVFDHLWGRQTGDGLGASFGIAQRF